MSRVRNYEVPANLGVAQTFSKAGKKQAQTTEQAAARKARNLRLALIRSAMLKR